MCLAQRAAVSSTLISSLQGIKRDILVQLQSVIVRMESNPWDSGSFVIKFSAIVSKGSASGICSSYISVLRTRKVIEVSLRACNCRTTLLVRRQVTHTCKSQWRDPRLASFIQGQEESDHTVYKGRKAERTSQISRATRLGFIYTFKVLLSKLSQSIFSKQ